MTSHTLYYAPGSCSLAAHIALEESGLEYQTKRINTAQGEQHSEEFLRLNPKAMVPLLQESNAAGEDFILSELPAILHYVASQAPDKTLMPTEPKAVARANEWFNWLGSSVHGNSVAMQFRTNRFTDDEADYPSIKARGKARLAKEFAQIEQHFTSHDWAVGERYSLVDAYLFLIFRWGNKLGNAMADNYPAWHANINRCLARSAVQKVVGKEGLLPDDWR